MYDKGTGLWLNILQWESQKDRMTCCSCIYDGLVYRKFILDVLNIVSACDDSWILCVSIICCHAVLSVGNVIGLCGSWFGVSILSMEESSDNWSVRAVKLLVQLLWNMFLSPLS